MLYRPFLSPKKNPKPIFLIEKKNYQKSLLLEVWVTTRNFRKYFGGGPRIVVEDLLKAEAAFPNRNILIAFVFKVGNTTGMAWDSLV